MMFYLLILAASPCLDKRHVLGTRFIRCLKWICELVLQMNRLYRRAPVFDEEEVETLARQRELRLVDVFNVGAPLGISHQSHFVGLRTLQQAKHIQLEVGVESAHIDYRLSFSVESPFL